MAGALPITFRIYQGNQLVREETLAQPVIKIGKLPSSHLYLNDEGVSRMHAVIEAAVSGDVSIIDLGSSRGTFVNGHKVNKAALRSGDQIAVGDTRIAVAIGEASASASASAAGKDAAPARPAVAASPTLAHAPALVQRVPVAQVQPAAAAAARPSVPYVAPVPPVPGGLGESAGAGDERAIEVAALLGDSVVTVKHLVNPRGGKVTPATYGLFIGGALMLIMAAAAFAVGLSNADFNATSRTKWLAEGRTMHEWRPQRISLAYDWMALGGLLTGLMSLTSGLVRLRSERQSPYFRIGSDAGVEHATSDAPSASFPLVAPRGDSFVCHITETMAKAGEMTVQGDTRPLAEVIRQGHARPSAAVPGAMELPIPAGARIRVSVGKSAFRIVSVPRPARHAVPLFAALESRAVAYLAGSVVVHLGMVALLNALPPDPSGLSLDLGGREARMTRVMSTAAEDPKEKIEDGEGGEGAEASEGAAMAGASGTMGSERSTRKTGLYAVKKRGDEPSLSRTQAIAAAREAGILGALRGDAGSFAALTATASFSSGFSDNDVFGGLVGEEVAEMQGGFGFGPNGRGPGGGGDGWGTIGTGKYNTIGYPDGRVPGFRAGPGGNGGPHGRRPITPQPRIGEPLVKGDLDKNIIRRYIRQKLPRISYCYEKQLTVNPGLEGTILTEFQIMPQGSVMSVSASGLRDEVSSCVAEVLKTITFPRPSGGGVVQVRYPFSFRPAGA